MTNFIKLIRVDNWIKNLFIFLPLFFSGELLNTNKFTVTLISALGFCFITSCVYIINDIFDIDFDKNHPDKKHRPIASGIISVNNSLVIGIPLMIVGLYLLWVYSMESFLLGIIYFIINVFYSITLKHIPIIDFAIISIGFVIRILIGGVVAEVELSQWIIIMVFLLSLFLAVTKRRDDVYQYETKDIINRRVVDKYTVEFMDKIITIISSVLIVSYLLFITSEDVLTRYSSKYLLITFLFVLIGVFRYNQLTYVFNKSSSPVKIFFNDLYLQIVLLGWVLVFFMIIYLN